MNIGHLREFVYLVETLSFNTASKHFFLSTSALSKHITAMEDELGIRLFDRNRHRVIPTEEGKAFYSDAVSVLGAYDRALHNIEIQKTGLGSTLRVGYLRNATRPYLAQFVQYLANAYPHLSLEINCMEYIHLIESHRTHQVDVLLTMNLDPEASWACDFEPIYTDRFYAVMSPRHPLAEGSSEVTAEDLAGKRLVLPNRDAYPGLSERFESFLPAPISHFDTTFYRDVDTLYYEVEQQGRIGFSSGHNKRQFADRVVFLPLAGVDTGYEVGAQWLKDMEPKLVDVVRDASSHCRKYMLKHPCETAEQ